MSEIERKWRLRFVPGELHEHSSLIEQGYILTDDPELRLRRLDNDFVMTVKGEGSLERSEWNTHILPWVFDSLWSKITCSLRKLRMTLGHKNYDPVPEIDTYLDALDGLFILECEFKSIDGAEAFELPIWAAGAMEVTYDPRYKKKTWPS